MPSPESLLAKLSGADPTITELIAGVAPLIVPFETLVAIDGWTIDPEIAISAAPFDDPSLVPDQRVVNALLVACDYAVRRGAQSDQDVLHILRRESPVSVVAQASMAEPIKRLVDRSEIGGPTPPAFARRARGHALSGTIVSDPALSFQERSVDRMIGDNALSSLMVHGGGTGDAISVEGPISDRWAVEIGLPSDTPSAQIDEIEREVALMPSFLRGLTSYLDDDGIVVGWRRGRAPDPWAIAVALHAWTMALFDLPAVTVRIVFGPAAGSSTVLTEMRARAVSNRLYRDAMRAGNLEPEGPADNTDPAEDE